MQHRRGGMERELMMSPAGVGGGFGGNAPGPMPMKAAARNGGVLVEKLAETDSKGGSAPPTRIREYFPETMLRPPILITVDQGRAELPVSFADSIHPQPLTRA